MARRDHLPPLAGYEFSNGAERPHAKATRLGQPLLVVPLFVPFTPLRLVSLRFGELPFRFRSRLPVFARGMLFRDCSAAGGDKTDHYQGDGNQRKDEPRDHVGRVLRDSDQVKAFTARATMRPSSASDTVDWTIIVYFALRVSGMTSVGLNAVAFVKPRCR